ncbi:MAG: hypothetical protein ACYTGG_05660 [Planctomycetota bacterium]
MRRAAVTISLALLPGAIVIVMMLPGCAQPPAGPAAAAPVEPVDAPARHEQVSPQAAAILSALAGRNIESTIRAWPLDTRAQDQLAALEWVRIESPEDLAADGFRHTLLVDGTSARFWVLRSDGIAGVRELRGPVMLDHHDQFVAAER